MVKAWVTPTESLRPYIDRIWAWNDEALLPDVLPGTGNEAIFNLGSPLSVRTKDVESKLPQAFIMSARHSSFAPVSETKARL
jgi:hypothetical protein